MADNNDTPATARNLGAMYLNIDERPAGEIVLEHAETIHAESDPVDIFTVAPQGLTQIRIGLEGIESGGSKLSALVLSTWTQNDDGSTTDITSTGFFFANGAYVAASAEMALAYAIDSGVVDSGFVNPGANGQVIIDIDDPAAASDAIFVKVTAFEGYEFTDETATPLPVATIGYTLQFTPTGGVLPSGETVIFDGNAVQVLGETHKGTSANNVLRGHRGDDTLNGLGGRDRLFGDDGDDTLRGGAGKDKLVGGDGDDTQRGGTGNDKLIGGAGHDVLAGGAGHDRFVFYDDWGVDTVRGTFGRADLGANGTNTYLSMEFNEIPVDESGGAGSSINVRNLDKIDLSHVTDIKSFHDLKTNHLTEDSNGNALIFSGDNAILLLGVSADSLAKGDFIF